MVNNTRQRHADLQRNAAALQDQDTARGVFKTCQRKTKEGVAVMFSISRALMACQFQAVSGPAPGALRAYSSHGGSTRTTSNLVPNVSTDSLTSDKFACQHQQWVQGYAWAPCLTHNQAGEGQVVGKGGLPVAHVTVTGSCMDGRQQMGQALDGCLPQLTHAEPLPTGSLLWSGMGQGYNAP